MAGLVCFLRHCLLHIRSGMALLGQHECLPKNQTWHMKQGSAFFSVIVCKIFWKYIMLHPWLKSPKWPWHLPITLHRMLWKVCIVDLNFCDVNLLNWRHTQQIVVTAQLTLHNTHYAYFPTLTIPRQAYTLQIWTCLNVMWPIIKVP